MVASHDIHVKRARLQAHHMGQWPCRWCMLQSCLLGVQLWRETCPERQQFVSNIESPIGKTFMNRYLNKIPSARFYWTSNEHSSCMKPKIFTILVIYCHLELWPLILSLGYQLCFFINYNFRIRFGDFTTLHRIVTDFRKIVLDYFIFPILLIKWIEFRR